MLYYRVDDSIVFGFLSTHEIISFGILGNLFDGFSSSLSGDGIEKGFGLLNILSGDEYIGCLSLGSS